MKYKIYFLRYICLLLLLHSCNSFERYYDPVVSLQFDIKTLKVGKDTGTISARVEHCADKLTSDEFYFSVTTEVNIDSAGITKGFQYFNREPIEKKSPICYPETKAFDNVIVYKQLVFADYDSSKDTVLLSICNNSITKIPQKDLPALVNINFMNFKYGVRGTTSYSNQAAISFYLTK